MPTKDKAKKAAAPKSRIVNKTAKAKRALPSVDPQQILGRAMLANVCISMWEGRKHDKEVTAKTNEDHKASADAGRFHKHLFGGKVQELSSIITAAANLRLVHYTNTLPWTDSGWRLLPTENFTDYTEKMREAIKRYNAAGDAFADVYEKAVRSAKDRLGDMYRASDYPSADAVRNKYRVSLDFSPLPAGGDFRVTLPKEQLAQLAADVEDRVAKSVELAMKDAWDRLGEAITDLREKLETGKYLRDSMIDRLRGVAEVLGRLNLTNDAALEETRKRVLRELTTFNADSLREDKDVREKAAAAADAILKSMAGVYTPASDDDDED